MNFTDGIWTIIELGTVAIGLIIWFVIDYNFDKNERYEECQECHRSIVKYSLWFKQGGMCSQCFEKTKEEKK